MQKSTTSEAKSTPTPRSPTTKSAYEEFVELSMYDGERKLVYKDHVRVTHALNRFEVAPSGTAEINEAFVVQQLRRWIEWRDRELRLASPEGKARAKICETRGVCQSVDCPNCPKKKAKA